MWQDYIHCRDLWLLISHEVNSLIITDYSLGPDQSMSLSSQCLLQAKAPQSQHLVELHASFQAVRSDFKSERTPAKQNGGVNYLLSYSLSPGLS